MIDWYQAFMLAVVGLWAFATDRDRAAARIILIATLGSKLTVLCVTHYIMAAWKLAIPGAIEVLTIACLWHWARNRTGMLQAACLIPAWVAHLICYVDVRYNTDVVYSRYETILVVVAALQIAAFHDTIRHGLRALVAWAGALRSSRMGGVLSAGLRHSVLRAPRAP